MTENLSAIVIEFNNSNMTGSEHVYQIIDNINEKFNIDSFIDSELITGKSGKIYLFIGLEFKIKLPNQTILKYLRNIQISLENSDISDIKKVKIYS